MVLTAWGDSPPKQARGDKTVADRFSIKIGDRLVAMQIAALPAELQQGLMFRQTMGSDEGMLFVFTTPQQMGFWMRNTILPLDIGYIDSTGKLKEIYPMYPLDEKPVASRSHAIQYCLEMNQGWYARHGVKVGAALDLKAVAAALQARGLPALAAGVR
jgi:uncharacterized membrane protein (UPF0127 family)